MTELLSEALRIVETLPPELQDQIAEELLQDIEEELAWQRTLAEPQNKLELLAQKALDQSDAGQTIDIGFDEL